MNTTETTTTELDLTAWCQQRATAHRDYEAHELPVYANRDIALVEWTVRTLGNPSLPESVEALRILAARHGLSLHQAGSIDRLIAFRNAKVWEATELVQRVRAARALAEGADGDGDFGMVPASDLLAALGEPHPAENRPAVDLSATA